MKTSKNIKKPEPHTLKRNFQDQYLDDVVDDDLLSLCEEFMDEKINSPKKQSSSEQFSTSLNDQTTTPTSSYPICCKHCQSQSNIEMLLVPCQVYICRTCLKKHRDKDNYRCISQGRAIQKFALTLEELRTGTVFCKDKLYKIPLIVKENRNPQGFGAPMKLYYEFQLLELATAKYGSLHELSRVIENREASHFQRTIQKKLTSQSKTCETKNTRRSAAREKFQPNKSDDLGKPRTSQFTETLDGVNSTGELLQEWEEI